MEDIMASKWSLKKKKWHYKGLQDTLKAQSFNNLLLVYISCKASKTSKYLDHMAFKFEQCQIGRKFVLSHKMTETLLIQL